MKKVEEKSQSRGRGRGRGREGEGEDYVPESLKRGRVRRQIEATIVRKRERQNDNEQSNEWTVV